MSSEENKKLLESVKSDITGSVEESKEDVLSYFIIGVFVSIIVLSVVFVGLQKARQNKLATLDTQISQDVTAPLKAMEKEKVQNDIVMKQLSALSSSLSLREKNSALLGDLKNNLYKKTYWDNFSVQKDSIVVSGKVDSFQDVAKVTAGLRNVKSISDVKLNSAVLDKDSSKVNYSINITYDITAYQATTQSPTPTSGMTAVPQGSAVSSPVAFNSNTIK